MNIFKEAKKNQKKGTGFNSRKHIVVWRSKKVSWSYLVFSYGIRRSDKIQVVPIWNTSHNNRRSILAGIWKFFVQLSWYRKESFNQDRSFFMRKRLWKFYQLVS